MNITYLGHSGFLIEWDECYMLFDYFEGDLPELMKSKKLYVFVSHHHHDHYNPKVFELMQRVESIEYIFSDDVHLVEDVDLHSNGRIQFVSPHQNYEFHHQEGKTWKLFTLKSTDEGVAFLLEYHDQRIYYAADLNLWLWKGESEEYNHNMSKLFCDEMKYLKEVTLDLAFAPLDPRQEEYYSKGIEALLETATVKYLFPMHFWKQPEIIGRFLKEKGACLKETIMLQVDAPGQTWKL